jgi:two-component system CheB/CheR fusion protein
MAAKDDLRSKVRDLGEHSRRLRARARKTLARSAELQRRAEALLILIVEDHRDTAEALRKLLVHEGHEAVVAETVCDAMRLCREVHFSRLLCDIGLPDGSGLDLVRDVKRQLPEIRAVALSGYAMQHDVDEAMQAGFDAHLCKPVCMADLLSKLA